MNSKIQEEVEEIKGDKEEKGKCLEMSMRK